MIIKWYFLLYWYGQRIINLFPFTILIFSSESSTFKIFPFNHPPKIWLSRIDLLFKHLHCLNLSGWDNFASRYYQSKYFYLGSIQPDIFSSNLFGLCWIFQSLRTHWIYFSSSSHILGVLLLTTFLYEINYSTIIIIHGDKKLSSFRLFNFSFNN